MPDLSEKKRVSATVFFFLRSGPTTLVNVRFELPDFTISRTAPRNLVKFGIELEIGMSWWSLVLVWSQKFDLSFG